MMLGATDIVAYDPDPQRRSAAAALGAAVVAEATAAADSHPDLVFVCSPPADHVAGVRLAISAAADVFVEKPLADRLDVAADVVIEARRARRRIWVGYNLRWHRGLRQAKDLLASGAIGQILHIRAEYGHYLPDWRPGQDYRAGYNANAKAGGGVLLDQSHEIDYVRWIAGEPVSVLAAAAKVSDLAIEVEDVALLVLRLSGGRFAEIHVDSIRREYTRGCTIIGSEGTIAWSLTEGVRVFDGRTRRWDTHATVPDPNEMYLEEARDLLAVLRGETRSLVSAEDALRTLGVVEAARRSIRERREIDLDPGSGSLSQTSESHVSDVASQECC